MLKSGQWVHDMYKHLSMIIMTLRYLRTELYSQRAMKTTHIFFSRLCWKRLNCTWNPSENNTARACANFLSALFKKGLLSWCMAEERKKLMLSCKRPKQSGSFYNFMRICHIPWRFGEIFHMETLRKLRKSTLRNHDEIFSSQSLSQAFLWNTIV